jgi:hypothetical protein
VLAAAVTQVALYAVIAVRTIGYAYPLEWMEGGTVDVMMRIRDGLPIYTAPTTTYVPYVYPPFYYWVSALVARFVGFDFLAPRLVSLAATCLVFAAIAAFVRRGGGDRVAAAAGVGLFAGTYEWSARWFHVARVDMLCLALLLAGLYVAFFDRSSAGAIVAGALLFLAGLTKQTGLLVAVVALPMAAVSQPKRMATVGGVLAVLCGATELLMWQRAGPWWDYFLFTLPARHGLAPHGSYWFVKYDLVKPLPLAIVASLVVAVRVLARRGDRHWWLSALLAGAIVASWASRLHAGGAANVLLPAYAALSVACALILADKGPVRLLGTAAVAGQLMLNLTQWSGAVPTAADRVAADRYVARLRQIDGDVIVWRQRFVPTRAGKSSWGFEMAAEDVLRSNDAAMAERLKAGVIATCRSHAVAGVVDPPPWLMSAVRFGTPIELFDSPTVAAPIAGAPKRPARYYPILGM